jgi:hypothetical protein
MKKKLLFSLLMLCVVLALLETTGRILEATLLPWQRSLPTAAPEKGGKKWFLATTGREGDKLQGVQMVADPERGWMLPPGSILHAERYEIRTNSLGLRGEEIPPKEPEEIRLLTLGDSSVYGDSVSEGRIFSSVAQQKLQEAWKKPVRAIVGAVPGHDSAQSLALLKNPGESLKPDWVIIGNFWSDVYRGDQSADPDDEKGYYDAKSVLRRSAAYRVLWQLLGPYLAQKQVRYLASKDDVGTLQGPAGTRTPLNSYLENMRAMVKLAHSYGARVVVLRLAAPMDLDSVPPPDTVLRFREVQALVAEESDGMLVDGPKLFRERGATVGFFADHVHPNALGHALLGAGLADVMLDHYPVAP